MSHSRPLSTEEARLQAWMDANHIAADLLIFDASTHSVDEAATAIGGSSADFVKNICLIGPDDELIVAIVRGEDRVSMKRVARALGLRDKPRMAAADEIVSRTGYGFGGTPSFGFEAIFLVDDAVPDMPIIYTGGGSAQALMRVTPDELLRANEATLARLRK